MKYIALPAKVKHICLLVTFTLFAIASNAQAKPTIKDRFIKVEKMISMRDGVKLYTAIYIPRASAEKYAFLMERTPYSCNPYGENNYPSLLGPGNMFANENYIYVYQDVRGRYMSEGSFEEVTPSAALSKKATDESSDCFDTIEWLIKNIDNNNGNVGIYGISYPGFYATAALPNAHPALKAASPQAPVTDEFEGDDAYHRGAFFLMDNFSFMNNFDSPRSAPWTRYPNIFKQNNKNAYDFYLTLGPLSNANKIYFNNQSKIWNEYLAHDTKDDYWQQRNIRTSLKNIQPAILVVGGWYDAEDLFGALKTYEAIAQNSKGKNSKIVMGPWTHGSWTRRDWSKYGTINFGSNTSEYFQKIELNFFNYHLKQKGTFEQAKATIFETGTNQWKTYTQWPPKQAISYPFYLGLANKLLPKKQSGNKGFTSYISDPANPVPYMQTNKSDRNNEYMVADQSFASKRNDVISFETEILPANITFAGPVTADMYISTTSTDVDLIVKVIDVLPADATDNNGNNIGGIQRLIRAEVLRGKFRDSYNNPSPFTPGQITHVKFQLNDIAHCFLNGHKIMVQIQSSWFPLVDRNPQKFMKIPNAIESDFSPAEIKVYHNSQYPSGVQFLLVK